MSVDLPSPTQTATAPPLRTVREAQGLGLREAAEKAGIDPAHLSRVERGRAALSVDALARLAKVLELGPLARMLAPYARHPRDSDGQAGNLADAKDEDAASTLRAA